MKSEIIVFVWVSKVGVSSVDSLLGDLFVDLGTVGVICYGVKQGLS